MDPLKKEIRKYDFRHEQISSLRESRESKKIDQDFMINLKM
jgi:hypothetical protein